MLPSCGVSLFRSIKRIPERVARREPRPLVVLANAMPAGEIRLFSDRIAFVTNYTAADEPVLNPKNWESPEISDIGVRIFRWLYTFYRLRRFLERWSTTHKKEASRKLASG